MHDETNSPPKQTVLAKLQELWPEGDMYIQHAAAIIRKKETMRFDRWMYIVPRPAMTVAEYTHASTYRQADDGRKLQVAFYQGRPADIGCSFKEGAITIFDLLKPKGERNA